MDPRHAPAATVPAGTPTVQPGEQRDEPVHAEAARSGAASADGSPVTPGQRWGEGAAAALVQLERDERQKAGNT